MKKSVTNLLILVNILIFIGQIFGLVSITDFAIIPSLVRSGQWYRLFTGVFLHGSTYHIMGNLYAFYYIGNECEKYGKKYYLALLASLFGSGLLVTLLSPTNTPTIGFSGVVFGIIGFYVVSFWKDDHHFDQWEIGFLMRVLIPNIIISFMPGVSWQGHAGGFIAGALIGLLTL